MKTIFSFIVLFVGSLLVAASAAAHGVDASALASVDGNSMGNLAIGLVGMAKVTGPLMSMDARGGYGGTLVFSGWKGRPTVRELVIPTNPKSADQMTARNRVRAGGAIQRFVNQSVLVNENLTGTDKAEIQAITPSGQAWNGYLVNMLIGAQGLSYTAAQAAWAALSGGEKTAWDNAAAALTPAIPAVAQQTAGGAAGTPLTAGNVFFLLEYTLYLMGLQAVPGATPTVYA